MSARTTPRELVSLAEAAQRLGICVPTLRRWIAADMADRQAGGTFSRVPGGRTFGTRYVIFRAVFERALVDGIEPDAPRKRQPIPFLVRRERTSA